MSLINEFIDLLENVSIYEVFAEYDNSPLDTKPDYFVTVGVQSEECEYNIQNSTDNFLKDKISFIVRLIAPNTATSSNLDYYFNNNILKPIAKSDTFNLISFKKQKPDYNKYLDRVELISTFNVECISKLED